MRRNPLSIRFGWLALLSIISTLPFVVGQGCGGTGLVPVTPTGISSGTTSTTGNVSPFFQFTSPATDISAVVGTVVSIEWTDSDADNNAAITLLADPDNIYGNGNERVILALALEDDTANFFDLDTSSLPAATYRIIARVNDSVNPELIAVAPGRLILIGSGLLVGNQSPTITMTQPDINVALSQNESTRFAFCGRDPDDDGLNQTIPDIIILLDTDQSTTDDLDLTGPNRESILLQACNTGPFPRTVGGVIIVGCAKDSECALLANATQFTFTLDVAQIPPRAGGDPYYPRVTMWDHTNPPVHSYSRGNISITSLGSGQVDLGQVGRSISGGKFYGFDAGGLAGFTGTSVGDLDNDGADDFVIVSRRGSGFGAGNFGSAHLIMGSLGVKFGNEVSLNSIGTLYRGAAFTMPQTTVSDGIVSVCQVADIDGDARSEVMFGMPYVEAFSDQLDDDPCHCTCDAPGCYSDILPNEYSATCLGPMLSFDHREGFIGGTLCSNDLDLTQITPLNGGYSVLVSSRNPITNRAANVVQLVQVGQGGETALPVGARFRGPWWDNLDFSQTVYPSAVIPNNRYGETVNTMPDMTDTSLAISPRFGSTLLTSSPMAFSGRGAVYYTVGQDFTRGVAFGAPTNAESWPYYVPGICQCPGVVRGLVYPALNAAIVGAAAGDHLGYAAAAGDYNLDGSRDILLGAPGATRTIGGVPVPQVGVVYVLFGRPDFPLYGGQGLPVLGTAFYVFDLQQINPPRMEIHGINANDQFGFMQTIVGDVNRDGLPDVGFSSQYADGPGGVDCGYIGVVFGGRRLTGENIFNINQVGSTQLPGFRIYGTQPGAHAGATINNAGDFNGDGTDDLLVDSPDEVRQVNGQNRRGVAYVIFGGPHLYNGSFSLSQVGTAQLPGMVIISPYVVGSAEEAPIDFIGHAGDVNGDGFSDILVGVSQADFVNPLEPNQRRNDAGEAYLIYGNNTGSNRIGG